MCDFINNNSKCDEKMLWHIVVNIRENMLSKITLLILLILQINNLIISK